MPEADENKEWKNVGCLWVIGAVLLCVLIVWIGALEWESNRNNRDACEAIGGEYQVVGEEFSAAHKTTVNVYGCVK